MAGPVLIAVNPFKPIPHLYSPHINHTYKKRLNSDTTLSPHIYLTADKAFKQMVMTGESQSILISGESGAGKTESTKYAMRYLADVASGGSGMEDRVLGTNVILEAFGNAKTVFNNNSSRFGKLIKIHFDTSYSGGGQRQTCLSSATTTSIVGAEIKTYLLEKSRVVKQAPNERNFHIFYQLCIGCCESDLGQKLHLGDPSAFAYLKQCTDIRGVNDKAGFQQVCEAMKGVGVSEEHQLELWRTLAAILWLGNIEFAETSDDEGQAMVHVSELTMPALTAAAQLLGCSSSVALASALTHQRLVAGGGDVIAKRRDVVGAMDARDALAKALYQAMFTKLVEDINLGLLGGGRDNVKNSRGKAKRKAATAITSTGPCLSILDIAGFESLPSGNGFEQLCINYANERLQRQFNHHLFHLEQSVYNEEGIDWAHIPFEDNQACVDLLEARAGSNSSSSSAAAHKQKKEIKKEGPPGVFALLDEECLFPNGSDASFASKLKSAFGSTEDGSSNNGSYHAHFAVAPLDRTEEFSINHFAGPVKYNSTGFLEKNKDNLSHELLELGQQSSRVYVQELTTYLLESKASTKAINKNQNQTVGGRFREQLHELMEHLDSTALHFVRCIKPNNDQCATHFNSPLVLHQLRCCGVGEVARIARAGYPTRLDHSTFAKRYSTLLSTPLPFDQDELSNANTNGSNYYKETCLTILRTFNINEDNYRLGRTRIFFRAGVLGLMEDKTARMIRYAVFIQAYWRMKVAKRRYREVRGAVLKIQAGWKGCVTRRWYEEMVRKYTVAAVTMQAVYRGRVARVRAVEMRREKEEEEEAEAMRQRLAREEEQEVDNVGDLEAITVRQHKSLEEEFNMSRNEIKAVLGLWTENDSAIKQWIVAHCPKDHKSAASGGILPAIISSPEEEGGGEDGIGCTGEEEEGDVLKTKLSLMEQYALKLEAKYKQSAQEVGLLRRALTTMEAAVPNDSPKKVKSRAVLHAATARMSSNISAAYLLLSAESSCDTLDYGEREEVGGGSYVSAASSLKPTPRVLNGRGTGGGGIASRMAGGGQKNAATATVGDENGQGHNVPPPPASTKEQAALGGEFERRRALFNDDADFIRDVASGKVNPTKEMSSDAELAKLVMRYKRWKKEFKRKLKAAQQAVVAGGGNGIGQSREKPAFGARLKSQLMLSKKKDSALNNANR
jgi:myosin-5